MERELNLTNEELIFISTFIEDCTACSHEGSTGGMYVDGAYITPQECYNLRTALKKINEYLYDNPTIYKEAYRKLKGYAVNK